MAESEKSIKEHAEEAQRVILGRIVELAPSTNDGTTIRNLAEAYAVIKRGQPGILQTS